MPCHSISRLRTIAVLVHQSPKPATHLALKLDLRRRKARDLGRSTVRMTAVSASAGGQAKDGMGWDGFVRGEREGGIGLDFEGSVLILYVEESRVEQRTVGEEQQPHQ